MNVKRIFAGAFLAPSAVPVAYFVLIFLFSGYVDSGEERLSKLIQVAINAVLPAGYMGSFFIGGPVLFVLNRLNRLTIKSVTTLCAAAFFVAGMLFSFSLMIEGDSRALSWQGLIVLSALVGLAGFLVALVFCLIAGVPWDKQHASR